MGDGHNRGPYGRGKKMKILDNNGYFLFSTIHKTNDELSTCYIGISKKNCWQLQLMDNPMIPLQSIKEGEDYTVFEYKHENLAKILIKSQDSPNAALVKLNQLILEMGLQPISAIIIKAIPRLRNTFMDLMTDYPTTVRADLVISFDDREVRFAKWENGAFIPFNKRLLTF